MTTEDVVQVSYYRHGTVLETCMTEEQVQTLFSKATPHTVGERTCRGAPPAGHSVAADDEPGRKRTRPASQSRRAACPCRF